MDRAVSGACTSDYVLQLRRRLIGAVPLEGNIRLADHIGAPFVAGIFRPRIYLPSSLEEAQREYV